jgi:uncharacterized membrane protein YciS (DUF1049 family)
MFKTARLASAAQQLEKKEKIGILMQEYGTLRSEVMLSLGAMNQFVIITFNAIIAAATVISATRTLLQGAITFAVLFALMIAIFWIQVANVARLSRRLRELEGEVNDRVGEPLLKWERNYAFTPLRLFKWPQNSN